MSFSILAVVVALAVPSDTVPLYDDLGDHAYRITAATPTVQAYFDQGLRLHWAFNHGEAIRAFREAQRLDPSCAMCWWGEALALGPNINLPMDSAAASAARLAIARAQAAAPGIASVEQALIDALARRYHPARGATRATLDSAYAHAMAVVARRFPGDDEVKVLRAEAIMVLRPWDYWSADGRPQPGIDSALHALEQVLATDPDHPGACHLYIHAVEARHPERAVACAERLASLMPGAGHLVHMPGHIYIRVGRYLDAITANEHAVHADETYLRDQRPAPGMYSAGYYPHNYDFLAFAAAMAGRRQQAIAAADKLASLAAPLAGESGMDFTQHHITRGLQLRVRFERWDEILGSTPPERNLPHARAMWHYAHGRAAAAVGRLHDADADLAAVRHGVSDPRLQGLRLEFNESPAILRVASAVLAGHLAAARREFETAVRHFGEAQQLEDALSYGEPPDWTVPVRQDLGAILLQAGRPEDAERAFRTDLERFPENGWSLHGLAQALERQGNHEEAEAMMQRYRQAWEGGDHALTAVRLPGARVARLGTCATATGVPLETCDVVYRTFGTLNAARDNAVMIPTWYAGRSEDMLSLLGREGWVDTTRFFAILVDAPGNGVSISPSTSRTQPGRSFPRLSLEDMVDVEHRLVTETLGIRRLHAVVGWSMGGIQAVAWSLRHPDAVDRIVSVAGSPRLGTYERYFVRLTLVLLDRAEAASVSREVLAHDLTTLWHLVASTPAQENRLPADSVEAMLSEELHREYLRLHPEDNRLQAMAVMNFDAFTMLDRGPGASPGRLLVFMPDDHVTTAEAFREFARRTASDTFELASPWGHLAAVMEPEIGVRVSRFLEGPPRR